MQKTIFLICLIFAFVSSAFAQKTAKAVAEEATRKRTLTESVEYLKNAIEQLSGAEKRSATAFLASIQEQMGKYADAQQYYEQAAAINAKDASGMPKKSTEQLTLDAIRCALSLGDSAAADELLNSNIKKSKDSKIIAYTKLYEQWSVLCKAQNEKETRGAVSALKEYSTQDSMKEVAPSILLTLWHITGDESWATNLKKSYPKSIEAGIVKGTVQQLPTPFWYFVPRIGADIPEIESEDNVEIQKTSSVPQQIATKQQLGLFRDEENAKRLVEKLKASGFSAKIDVEQRPTGMKYYLVYVPEKADGSVGELLRAAGFECYPLFE